MKISPSYIQLLSHFTIQIHDAKSTMEPTTASILDVTVILRLHFGWFSTWSWHFMALTIPNTSKAKPKGKSWYQQAGIVSQIAYSTGVKQDTVSAVTGADWVGLDIAEQKCNM